MLSLWTRLSALLGLLGVIIPIMVTAQANLPDGFTETTIAAKFNFPTAMAFLSDGRIVVTEKAGLVKVIKGGIVLSQPLLDIRDKVNDYWDRGLLSIVADPDFATKPYIYLYYVYEDDTTGFTGPKTARISRFTVVGDTSLPLTEKVILGGINAEDASHNGGGMAIDGDRNLWISLGDAASFTSINDAALRAQDLSMYPGKLLHIDLEGNGLPSNPYYDVNYPSSIESRVYARGFRNPFRLNIEPTTGIPYVADVGWNAYEEINRVDEAGLNFGWPCYEGSAQQSGYGSKPVCQSLYIQGDSAVTQPFIEWEHAGSGGAAIAGPFGSELNFPWPFDNGLFYADYVKDWIRFAPANGGIAFEFATGLSAPVMMLAGPDQSLYYVAIGSGEIRRIAADVASTPSPTPAPTSDITDELPVPIIAAPMSSYLFAVGDEIIFAGSATDGEGSELGASALSWAVILQHCSPVDCHDHPFETFEGVAGSSFVAIDHGDGTHFILRLTAEDSAGNIGTTSISIFPRTVKLTIDTEPSGLKLVYGANEVTTPFVTDTIVGSSHTLTAPLTQGAATFASWSDGGAAQHDITVGDTDVKFIATYCAQAPSRAPSEAPSKRPKPCDVKLKVKAPKKVRPGKSFKLDVSIGSAFKHSFASDAEVVVTLPEGVSFVDSKVRPKARTDSEVSGQDVTITLRDLGNRRRAKLTLTLRAQSSVSGPLSFPVAVNLPGRGCFDHDIVHADVAQMKKGWKRSKNSKDLKDSNDDSKGILKGWW